MLLVREGVPSDCDASDLKYCQATFIVTATATDVGGVVAGMEASFNAGERWHPM